MVMEKLVEHRRILIGIALVVVPALLVGVPLNELPAGMAVIGLETCVIGALPLAFGFVAQLALRGWELRDRALLLFAAAAVLVFGILGHSSAGMPLGQRILSELYFVLLLTWFAGLGAASARAIRRGRLARRSAPAPGA